MDLKEIGLERVEWMHLAEGRDQRRTVMNKVMNLGVSQKAWNLSS
jgi:hypothetical protein